jgi:hypothetical protein
MKNITFIILLLVLNIPFRNVVHAQGFHVDADTIYVRDTGIIVNALNNITPDSVDTAGLIVKWQVTGCDFPSDWLNNATSFCDNNLCWGLNNLWPSSLVVTSSTYLPAISGAFRYFIDLTNATTMGTHYITLFFYNSINPSYTAKQTYIVTFD